MHFGANEPIPLQSFDIFWRKLDLEPSIVVQDVDLDFDNELQYFKRNIENQSPFGKSNFLVDEPEYHINNRGRPSLKITQQISKKLHLPTQDPPNSSSLIYADPFLNKIQTHYPDPFMNTNQPYNPHPYMNTNQSYHLHLLTNEKLDIFHPYITRVQNVVGDGNCGFRAIAACLGHDEDSWRQIRMDLLNELSVHYTMYTSIFTEAGVQQLHNILNHFEEGFAPENHWMDMPDTGLLIASRYNVVVIFLSKRGDTMCLPLWSSPSELQPHYICAIARINDNHFVKLELQGDFPIPPTHPQWSRYSFDPTWENPYFNRQNMYNQLKFTNCNRGYVKTRINVDE